jgi:hypothetical protein
MATNRNVSASVTPSAAFLRMRDAILTLVAGVAGLPEELSNMSRPGTEKRRRQAEPRNDRRLSQPEHYALAVIRG